MAKYAIGIDFGTLSARALVAEVGTGREAADAVCEYAHGVMDRALPTGEALPPHFALQHPLDYLSSMEQAVRAAVESSGVDRRDIAGIGIDFTASTLLPVDESGTPLCLLDGFSRDPHAYVKLWKHHGAQEYANRMTRLARERGETWLPRYGGKVSSEWTIPKIWEAIDRSPRVREKAAKFVDAGDWIVQSLTGNPSRSLTIAGYKAFWNGDYPDNGYFAALDPRMDGVIDRYLSRDIQPLGSCAGHLTPDAAGRLGLAAGIPVAVANVDAHVSLPAAGMTESGDLLMIIGTSICHILLSDAEKVVPGMCGAVQDGVIPGLIGYEAGQSCGGDHYDWAARVASGEERREAEAEGISLHELLTRQASRLLPGESGLIALDWWNGNRSVLVDADLTGMLLGLTLSTRGCEIYRALIEATAYGTRTILDNFASSGVPVRRIAACGGIARKNPMVMQIFADVTGREIRVARSGQAPALGSAMWGAVAAGIYRQIGDAAREMGGTQEAVYRPIPENREIYDRLYREYQSLHDYFGRGENDVMKRLLAIRRASRH